MPDDVMMKEPSIAAMNVAKRVLWEQSNHYSSLYDLAFGMILFRGTQVVVDRDTELRVYDALPTKWRRLVDSLPIPQSVSKIQEYRSALGDKAGYDRIVEVFSQKYPGWVPPDSGALTLVSTSASPVRVTPRRAKKMIKVPTYGD
jgi:hypothetical protein